MRPAYEFCYYSHWNDATSCDGYPPLNDPNVLLLSQHVASVTLIVPCSGGKKSSVDFCSEWQWHASLLWRPPAGLKTRVTPDLAKLTNSSTPIDSCCWGYFVEVEHRWHATELLLLPIGMWKTTANAKRALSLWPSPLVGRCSRFDSTPIQFPLCTSNPSTQVDSDCYRPSSDWYQNNRIPTWNIWNAWIECYYYSSLSVK